MWSLLLALGSQTASATTYGRVMTLAELTDASTRVVTGTVDETQSYWRDGQIWTRVEVGVTSSLVGPRYRTVNFDVIGGSIDGLNLTVPGAPVFDPGREVLLFLDDDSLVGFGQGAFTVEAGVARRDLGPLLPGGPDDFVIREVLPDREESYECLRPVLWNDNEDGWSLRAVDHLIGREGDLEARSLRLVGGLEYQFRVCGDQHSGETDVYLVDEEGEILTRVTVDQGEAFLRYVPTRSHEVRLLIRPAGLPAASVASSLSVSVSYR